MLDGAFGIAATCDLLSDSRSQVAVNSGRCCNGFAGEEVNTLVKLTTDILLKSAQIAVLILVKKICPSENTNVLNVGIKLPVAMLLLK